MFGIKRPIGLLVGLPLIGLCLLMPSCMSDKKDTAWQNQSLILDEDTAEEVKDSVDFILKKAMQYNTRFETFSAQTDIKVKAQGIGIGLSGSLRIADNRMIWGSITKFIELVRFSITPDTLTLWSKLDNTAVIYTDTVLEIEGRNIHMMPFIYRFAQCFLMCQLDTVMLEGTRTLNAQNPDLWIVDGVVNDSIAWQCRLGRSDFRIKQMLVSVSQKGTVLQIELNYLPDGGFMARISADRKEIMYAQVKYGKVKWNEEQTYPMKLNSGTKIKINEGLMKESREFMSDPAHSQIPQ